MALKKMNNFQREGETLTADVVTVKLSKDGLDRKCLDEFKLLIKQPKDSTALKIALEISTEVLLSQPMNRTLSIIFKNKQKNWRTGSMPEYQ